MATIVSVTPRPNREKGVTGVDIVFGLTKQEAALLPANRRAYMQTFGPARRYDSFVTSRTAELSVAYVLAHRPFGSTNPTVIAQRALEHINSKLEELRRTR